MRIAMYGTIPDKYWEHNPEMQDNWGDTVAINLARKDIIPP